MKRALSRIASIALSVALPVTVAGCHEGTGSDIGPRIPVGPTYDYRVLVRDDAGQAVTGALVSVSGSATTAATGQTGRAFFRQELSGSRVVTVDGANAAASDVSRLGAIAVVADLPDGDELPFVVYLPDHGTSVGLTLTAGVQGAAASLFDDDATPNESRSGAELTIGSGETVTLGTATTVELRTGKLSVGHVPPTLPAGAIPLLSSRAVYVHPADVGFATGAGLSIPNDLGLTGSQTATVYRLDPATGAWIALPLAATLASGRIAAPPGSIKTGGLYCFARTATATAVVSGRVVDADDNGVPGALVRAPQASVRSDGDGRFELPATARANAAGSNRAITVEIDGGRRYTPVQARVAATLNAPTIDLGEVTLQTRPATNVRLMMINRGRVDQYRRLRISGRSFLSGGDSTAGADGVVCYDDVAADVIGFLSSEPRDINIVERLRGSLFLRGDLLDNASSVFIDETGWRTSPTDGTLMQVVDELGTGPIYEAHAVTGDVAGQGGSGRTDLNGFLGVNVGRESQITMVFRSEAGGRTVTSAYSVLAPDSGRIEAPLERARPATGAFRRFGVFAGDLTGTAGSNTKSVRATGRLSLSEFYDQILFGVTTPGTPSLGQPSATSTAYRIGVPAPAGHLAAVEGTTTSGVFALERLGFLLDQSVTEGATTNADIPLVAAGTPFLITNGVANLDAAMSAADLQFDVAGQLPSGLLVDLARSVGGASIGVSGSDATVSLPALPAAFDRYVLGLRATQLTDVGLPTQKIIRQQVVVQLDGATVPDAPLLGLPALTAPVPGAAVSAGGFTASFTLPPTCQYTVVSLRSETPTDVRDWTLLVSDTATQVKFFQFPSEVPQILEAGRTWNLTVTAFRIDSGLLVDPSLSKREVYSRIVSNWVGLPAAKRQVRAVSGVSIKITN